jgi:hypothetical protein
VAALLGRRALSRPGQDRAARGVRGRRLTAALDGQHVIIEPNSPSRGVLVAFIEVSGAPVELMQIDHEARPDL